MWAQVFVTALAFKQSRAQQNLSDRNKTGLSCPNTWATATSKKIHDFGRVSFPFFVSRGYLGGSARRVKRQLTVCEISTDVRRTLIFTKDVETIKVHLLLLHGRRFIIIHYFIYFHSSDLSYNRISNIPEDVFKNCLTLHWL